MHARLMRTDLAEPEEPIRRMVAASASAGVLAAEDLDQSSVFVYPASTGRRVQVVSLPGSRGSWRVSVENAAGGRHEQVPVSEHGLGEHGGSDVDLLQNTPVAGVQQVDEMSGGPHTNGEDTGPVEGGGPQHWFRQPAVQTTRPVAGSSRRIEPA